MSISDILAFENIIFGYRGLEGGDEGVLMSDAGQSICCSCILEKQSKTSQGCAAIIGMKDKGNVEWKTERWLGFPWCADSEKVW